MMLLRWEYGGRVDNLGSQPAPRSNDNKNCSKVYASFVRSAGSSMSASK
jgi:hypothetical protein